MERSTGTALPPQHHPSTPSQPGPRLYHSSVGPSAGSGPLPCPTAPHHLPRLAHETLCDLALAHQSSLILSISPICTLPSRNPELLIRLPPARPDPHPLQLLCAQNALFLQGLTQVRLSLRGGPENPEHAFSLPLLCCNSPSFRVWSVDSWGHRDPFQWPASSKLFSVIMLDVICRFLRTSAMATQGSRG